jgi:hypothetical protein
VRNINQKSLDGDKMKVQKEIFILNATREKPDGTVEQLSNEEAQVLFSPDGYKNQMPDGTVTITWIEGQPEDILNILLGYPCFE